jgi:cyclophilin family peptidyl-prolyl cis-trans isomerase
MTKFVADAKAARSGKSRSLTGKDRRKELENFQRTGYHPSQLRGENALPKLPVHSLARPFYFLDYCLGHGSQKQSLKRIVIELYQDIVPAAVGHFMSQCAPGTRIQKISGLACFGQFQHQASSLMLKAEDSLRHVDGCVLSLARDGTGYAIVTARALHLDEKYQVIGRVRIGQEAVGAICSTPLRADDSPVDLIELVSNGTTDSTGEKEFDSNVDGKSKGDPKELLAEVRRDLQSAIQMGLKRKTMNENMNCIGGSEDMRRKKLAFADDTSSSSDEEE